MTKHAQTLARLSTTQLERFLVELANLQVSLETIGRFQGRFVAYIPPFDQSWLDKVIPERRKRLAEISAALEQYKRDGDAEDFRRAFLGDDPLEKRLTEEILEPDGVEELDINKIEKGLSSRAELNPRDVGDSANTIWILLLRNMLRELWAEPDLRQKEWKVFVIRYYLYNFERDAFSDKDLLSIFHPERFVRIPPPMPFEQALVYLIKSADKARYCANPECPAPYFFVQRKNQRYCSEICAAPAQRELKRKWWAEHGEEWRTSRQEKKPSKSRTGKGKITKSKQTTKKGGK